MRKPIGFFLYQKSSVESVTQEGAAIRAATTNIENASETTLATGDNFVKRVLFGIARSVSSVHSHEGGCAAYGGLSFPHIGGLMSTSKRAAQFRNQTRQCRI